MQRRKFLVLIGGPHVMMPGAPAFADSSGPQLASYYDRHMALLDGVAHGWTGRGAPVRMRAGSRQVGVSQDAYFALQNDGRLISWGNEPETASLLMPGLGAFASGQYGDGRLTATADFVNTAGDAVAVKAHTGHALYLSQGGVVMGTGGNRYGPLGAHGLGDKADRWGRVFDGARAIATGSRHSVAIRTDGTLWAWGGGFGIEPRRLLEGVVAVAAGNTATIALRADGSLLQWDGGAGPSRLHGF
jgi:Regulator of chromosome condensation (RCC1) repeat